MTDQRVSAPEPILWVPDVAEAIEHYHRVLGFDAGWRWGDPPTHGGTRLDDCRLQFSRQPECPNVEMWIAVRALEPLFERLTATGANVVEPPGQRPWGAREMVVRDHLGNWLRFAEPAWEDRPRGEPVAGLRIEADAPAPEVYAALVRSVGWDFSGEAEALRAARATFFAYIGEEAVGCALVMGDEVGTAYLRDVVVRPEWQSRGVGTALMTAVAEWLDAKGEPESYATLVTGANREAFYGKFGFRSADASGLRAMYRWIPARR